MSAATLGESEAAHASDGGFDSHGCTNKRKSIIKMSEPQQTIESNSEKAKRAAKNTGILYVRMILMMFIGLYTSRVILQSLGISDFGLYNVIGGVIGFLGFINSSMGVATMRYVTYEQGQHSSINKLHLVFCTARSIHIVLSAIVFLVAETIGLWYVMNVLVVPEGRMTATLIVYQFTILTSIVSILSVPYNALITSHEKMSAFAYIAIYEALANLGIAFILPFISFDRLIMYGLLIMFLQISVRLIYDIYCRRHFPEVKGKWVFDKLQFKGMLSFAVWITNGTLAVVAYTQGLNLLLNAFFGPVVNAARGVAVQVQQKIFAFSNSFQSAVKPQVTKSYSEGDFGYLHKLVINTSNYSFFLLYILSLPVFIEAPFILDIWLDEVPEYSVSFLRLTLIVGMLESLKMPMNTSIHATGNIKKFQMIEATALLMIVPVSYIFLKLGYSPISVFVVQAIFFLIAQIIRGIIVCPAIHMKSMVYFRDCLLKIFVVTLLPSVFMFCFEKLLPNMDDWIHFIISCLASFILSLLSIYFLGINRELRTKVIGYVKLKIFRI